MASDHITPDDDDRYERLAERRILFTKNLSYANGQGWQRPAPWAEEEIGKGVARCPRRLVRDAQP